MTVIEKTRKSSAVGLNRRAGVAIVSLMIWCLLPYEKSLHAGAITNVWVGPDNGNWSAKTNWNFESVPMGGDTARFTRRSSTCNVVLDGGTAVNAVELDKSACWRIKGAGNALNVANLFDLTATSTVAQQWFQPQLTGSCRVNINGGWMYFSSANTYTGTTTVCGDGLLEGLSQTTPGATPFGSTNAGTILCGGSIQLDATNTAVTTEVDTVTIQGWGKLAVDAKSFASTTILSAASVSVNSVSRDPAVQGYRRDVLYVNGNQGSLGNRERIVAAGTPVTNKLPGYFNVSKAAEGTTAADFAAYDSSTGFAAFTAYVTDWGAASSESVMYDATNATLSGSYSVWGLKTASDSCLIGGTATINVGPGGVIIAQMDANDGVNTKGFGSGITIAFGDNEGVVNIMAACDSYHNPASRSGPEYGNRLFSWGNSITGNKGLTIHGQGTMCVGNSGLFTNVNPLTVHKTWLVSENSLVFTNDVVVDGAGIGRWGWTSQAFTFNGPVMLLNGGLMMRSDYGVGSDTVNFNGKISGAGALKLDGPGAFYVKNPTNDWTGGMVASAGATVEATMSGALGSGPIAILGTSELTLNAASDQNWTLTNSISGSGTLVVETGSNTAYTLTVAGRKVSPGDDDNAGTLTINGRLKLDSSAGTNSILCVNLNGVTDYDQLKVNGGLLDLSHVALGVNLGYVPAVTDEYFIVVNSDTVTLSGTFAGLPESAMVTIPGSHYGCRVSYTGNADGGSVANDIKLYEFFYMVPGTILFIR